MKKSVILSLLVFSLLLLTGCSKSVIISENGQKDLKATARELLERGENLFCSFTFENETSKESGEIYTYKGKMKSTAKVLLKKEVLNIEITNITKDGYTYIRSSTQTNQGGKFKNLNKEDQKQYKEDPLDDKELNLICEKSDIDENIFIIPANISFVDITDYLIDK